MGILGTGIACVGVLAAAGAAETALCRVKK